MLNKPPFLCYTESVFFCFCYYFTWFVNKECHDLLYEYCMSRHVHINGKHLYFDSCFSKWVMACVLMVRVKWTAVLLLKSDWMYAAFTCSGNCLWLEHTYVCVWGKFTAKKYTNVSQKCADPTDVFKKPLFENFVRLILLIILKFSFVDVN